MQINLYYCPSCTNVIALARDLGPSEKVFCQVCQKGRLFDRITAQRDRTAGDVVLPVVFTAPDR